MVDEPMVALWLFLAFAVERLVEIIVRIVPKIQKAKVLGIEVPVLISLMLSLMIAAGTDLDFFAVFHVRFLWPCVGYIFTALVMTGGANFIHDLVGWVRVAKEVRQSQASSPK